MPGRPTPISFQDMLSAFEFVSLSSSLGDHRALVCRQSGKIYWRSEFSDVSELNDELPDDIEDDEKYIAIPDKRELDLGTPLVMAFAREHLPDDFDEVQNIFRARRAYARFRALLVRRNALDRWHDFESKATERALRDWCELNAIALDD